MRDGYARKDFQLRLVFQSYARSVDRTISAVLQIFVAVDRGAFSIRGSRNEGSRNGWRGRGFRCFNGSLLSITIGFTDERTPCTLRARSNAYDVLTAHASRIIRQAGARFRFHRYLRWTRRDKELRGLIHRERTIIGVAMVTERMGNPTGIAVRLSIFLAKLRYLFSRPRGQTDHARIRHARVYRATVKTCHRRFWLFDQFKSTPISRQSRLSNFSYEKWQMCRWFNPLSTV